MNGNKKKAVVQCCCVAGCVGCCLPVDYSVPQYPDGVVKNIPFQFVAPNCDELNGDTNTFVPINPTSSVMGKCGPCSSYLGQNVVVLSGVRLVAIGRCLPTPCSVNVCLILDCGENESVAPGLDSCCGRMRLWIGTSEQQAEDDGSKPAQSGSFSCTSWKKVNALQCACDPEDGVSARFPFSLNFSCPKYTTGPCAGEDNCCKVVCNLTGAEIVI